MIAVMTHEAIAGNEPGPVFGPGPEDWWDSERVSSAPVLREPDGSWKLWYYGRDADFDRDINLPTGRVGLVERATTTLVSPVRETVSLGHRIRRALSFATRQRARGVGMPTRLERHALS